MPASGDKRHSTAGSGEIGAAERRRLLIRPGAIGDCLLALASLPAACGTEYTEVWAPRPIVPLVQFADAVRAIADTGIELVGLGDLPPPPAFVERISSFDSVWSWYGAMRPAFRQAVAGLGPQWRFFPALPPHGNDVHAADFYADQVGAPRGLAASLALRPAPQRKTVVFHPFSGSQRKNWPIEQFRALSRRLPLPVEWVAGPEETLPGATRLDDLLALAQWLAGCKLFIGNDSGVSHLAAAAGCSVLCLFGSTSPEVWGPRGHRVHTLRRQPLTALSVDEVEAAARQLLCSEPAKSPADQRTSDSSS